MTITIISYIIYDIFHIFHNFTFFTICFLICFCFNLLKICFKQTLTSFQMSIGIERFMAICTPMRINRLSKKTSRIFILSVWIVAAIFAAPYLIYHRVFNRGNMVHCLWSFNLSSKIR